MKENWKEKCHVEQSNIFTTSNGKIFYDENEAWDEEFSIHIGEHIVNVAKYLAEVTRDDSETWIDILLKMDKQGKLKWLGECIELYIEEKDRKAHEEFEKDI